MEINRKIFLTALYIVLLALLHTGIFALSAQDGDTSGELSMRLSGRCADLFGNLSGQNRNGAGPGEPAENFERPLRNLAHFTEYACMGALIYLLWSLWLQSRKLLCLVPTAWVFASACLDEFHQYFVPGRHAGFSDVCLDTLGGVAGLLLVLLLQKLSHRYTRKGFRPSE